MLHRHGCDGNRGPGNAFRGLNIARSNNTIGGTAAAARNVVSGNNNAGIFMTAGTTGNLVQGNFIGTNAAGTGAIGNGSGVVTEGQSGNFSSHTIGGTAPGARNIISGNNGPGISIGGTLSGSLVQGNFIGTDVTGNTAVGNASDGVIINFGSANNTIGGTTPAARNLISGNGANGVRSDYHPNTVQGNFIGTQGNGVSPLGNGANGVLIISSQRYKQDIKPLAATSQALYGLKPVSFRLKKEFDPTQALGFGLIAEEVEKVDPALVYRNDKGQVESVRYDMVNAMLLNEFLKAHRKVQEQEATIARLTSTDAKQEAMIANQQKQIEALTAGLQKVSAQLEVSRPAPQTAKNTE